MTYLTSLEPAITLSYGKGLMPLYDNISKGFSKRWKKARPLWYVYLRIIEVLTNTDLQVNTTITILGLNAKRERSNMVLTE